MVSFNGNSNNGENLSVHGMRLLRVLEFITVTVRRAEQFQDSIVEKAGNIAKFAFDSAVLFVKDSGFFTRETLIFTGEVMKNPVKFIRASLEPPRTCVGLF